MLLDMQNQNLVFLELLFGCSWQILSIQVKCKTINGIPILWENTWKVYTRFQFKALCVRQDKAGTVGNKTETEYRSWFCRWMMLYETSFPDALINQLYTRTSLVWKYLIEINWYLFAFYTSLYHTCHILVYQCPSKSGLSMNNPKRRLVFRCAILTVRFSD